MTILRTLTIGATLAAAAAAFAQGPAAGTADWTAKMDQHMTVMRDAHDKMSRATTPDERQALMNEQMKLMHNGMGMMGGMGPGATGPAGMGMGSGAAGTGGMGAGGMGGAGAMPGRAAAPADMATRQHMLEKRMEMMQSMMQTMLDTVPSTPARK